eukprot:Rmarinus@m.2624
MEQLKEKLSDLEDRLSRYSSLLPKVGRCLLVLTFMEDALRLLMQWEEQSLFLRQLYMPSFFGTRVLAISNACSNFWVICSFSSNALDKGLLQSHRICSCSNDCLREWIFGGSSSVSPS